MKRRAMALALGVALVTAFMPAYADGGEGAENQVSEPVQVTAPESEKEASTPPAVAETHKPQPTPVPTPQPTPEPFTAQVEIELENEGQLYFGDKVVLNAEVKQANAEYTVRWEYYNVDADIEHGEDPWVLAHKGEKYEFTVNEENARLTYRLVLNDEVFVKDYKLPTVIARPEEVIEPEEEGETIEPEETTEPKETAESEETTDPEETKEPTEVPNEPDDTEESAQPEAGEESTEPEETEEPETNLEDALDPNRSIVIRAEWEGEELHFGDEVTLVAELSGYEGAVYELQWQMSVDEEEWTDVEGAIGDSYAMIVTEDNYQTFWRVIVTVTDIAADDAE